MNIFEAVQKGDIETVKAYIKYNGDVNDSIQTGSTLLMIAATYGNTDVVEALIKAGADVNAVNYDGMTALMYSMLKTSSISTVKALIAAKADVNATFPRSNSGGTTALLLSVGLGNREITKLLIDSGADLKAKDNYGDTALSLAEHFGNSDMAELLKSYGE